MGDNYAYLQVLFTKYSAGTATQKEVEELLSLLASGNFDHQVTGLMEEEMAASKPDPEFDTERGRGILRKIEAQTYRKHKFTKLLRPWLSVAAVLALVIGGLLFYNAQEQKSQLFVKNNIAPGRQGATLILSNGKRIRLSNAANGELAKEAGVVITKDANGQLLYEIKNSAVKANTTNTLATAKGETYQIRLPDGSLVWLNSASSLTYSARLNEHGKRMVKLDGEGYFEIAKDKAHPFIVKTDHQEVEVLGTHFNISSYNDDPAEKTTLIEGSIKMTALGKQHILKPGQQGRLEAGRNTISTVDTELAIAWKNNLFMFESEPIEAVMKMVERWYDVEVVYVGDKITERFSGGISRLDNISRALNIMEITGAVHFKIEGRKIYVSKSLSN